jgi:hypothetical protein
MSFQRTIAFLLLVALPVMAANLEDTLLDGFDGTTSPELTFKLAAITSDGTNTMLDVERKVALTNGHFALKLRGGVYTVGFGNSAKTLTLLIRQNDTNTYTLSQVATNLATFTYTNHLGEISWRLAVGQSLSMTTNNPGTALEKVTIRTAGITTNAAVAGLGTLLITNGVVMGIETE